MAKHPFDGDDRAHLLDKIARSLSLDPSLALRARKRLNGLATSELGKIASQIQHAERALVGFLEGTPQPSPGVPSERESSRAIARRPRNLDRMSYSDLVAIRDQIDALLIRKQAEEKEILKLKLAEMAKASGFSIDEVIGKGSRKGSVAIKYRDPKNPLNTWTGRGRMPRWMAAATARGLKKDHFEVD